MSIPVTVQHTGSMNGSPATPTTVFPSLQEIANTSFSRTYSQRQSGTLSVIGATDLAPFTVPFGSVVKGRVIFLRVTQSIKLVLSTPVAADQEFNVSDMILLHNPTEGDQVTSLKLVGTADVEFVVIGD